jgi:hypothetical protein
MREKTQDGRLLLENNPDDSTQGWCAHGGRLSCVMSLKPCCLIAGVSSHSSMLSLDVGIFCDVAAFCFSLFFVRNMSGLAVGCKSAYSGMSQFPCFLKQSTVCCISVAS